MSQVMGVVGDPTEGSRDSEDLDSERRRVQELLRFFQPTAADKHNTDLDVVNLSPDPTLTALAQLGALRTNCDRSFISLMTHDSQHILAEATRTISLLDKTKHNDGDQVYLGARTLDLQWGVCPSTIKVFTSTDGSLDVATPNITAKSSSYVMNDMSLEGCFGERPYVKGYPHMKFYAEVPLETPSGYVIGSYCVVDNRRRENEDHEGILSIITEVASTIMSHLELVQFRQTTKRAERMVDGLSQFVEGVHALPTTSGTHELRTPPSSINIEELRPPVVRTDSESTPSPSNTTHEDPVCPLFDPGNSSNAAETFASAGNSTNVRHLDTIAIPGEDSLPNNVAGESAKRQSFMFDDIGAISAASIASIELKATLARASSLIREAIDLDGVLFLDSCTSGYESRLSQAGMQERTCAILSYSARSESPNGDNEVPRNLPILSVYALQALLGESPTGGVFFFDKAGFISASHSGLHISGRSRGPAELKHSEAGKILDFLPGAQSIALWPLRDSSKPSSLIVGLAWSSDFVRPIRVEDFTYLKAFGNSIMVEMSRLEIMSADRAKSDFLSSISHELRSPLHGILANAELLSSTSTGVIQDEMIDAVEICGRTLLDTMNHLLDFAKINNFNTKAKNLATGSSDSESYGLNSLTSDFDLSSTVQDVIQGVLAGHKFQESTASARSASLSADSPDAYRMRLSTKDALNWLGNPIMVILDIQMRPNWVFSSEAGAWKRILMNLFGNALKYTEKGYVKVSLQSEDITATANQNAKSIVTLRISDSGKGMSQEYLKHHLFTPFAQEDILSVGAGLGLSIVQQIVTALGGSIEVDSEQNVGTTIIVSVPLDMPRIEPELVDGSEDKIITQIRQETKGLIISNVAPMTLDIPTDVLDIHAKRMLELKLSIEKLATDWFDMAVTSAPTLDSASGDVIITTDTELDLYLQNHDGRAREVWDAGLIPVIVLRIDADDDISPFISSRAQGTVATLILPVGPRKLAKALADCLKYLSQRGQSAIPDRTTTLDNCPRLFSSQSTETPPAANLIHESLPPTQNNATIISSPEEEYATSKKAPQVLVAAIVSNSCPAEINDGDSTTKSPNILLVEDNEINLKILVTSMKRLNYKYATATNGVEAVQAYETAGQPFDFVIMDISMPVMDGYTATRHIRLFEVKRGLKPVTVIALTGLASAKAQQEAFSSGVDTFLTKPVRMDELKRVLGR